MALVARSKEKLLLAISALSTAPSTTLSRRVLRARDPESLRDELSRVHGACAKAHGIKLTGGW